jgi:hypothetical protein
MLLLYRAGAVEERDPELLRGCLSPESQAQNIQATAQEVQHTLPAAACSVLGSLHPLLLCCLSEIVLALQISLPTRVFALLQTAFDQG